MSVPVPIYLLTVWFQFAGLLIENLTLNDKEVVAVSLTLLVFALSHHRLREWESYLVLVFRSVQHFWNRSRASCENSLFQASWAF